jgi:diguanylate cyclase (GGDEF)-like protein
MKFGLRSKLLIIIGTLIGISLADFLLITSTQSKASERLEWVTHTQQVINESEAFLGYLRDTETGQRGYLLTLTTDYLEPYHNGVKASRQSLDTLNELTRDNPAQLALLSDISRLMDAKFLELSETIGYASLGDTAKALEIVKSDQGKELMDQIRILVDEFITHEEHLLEERTRSYEEHNSILKHLLVLEVSIFLVILVFISFYLQRTIIRPLELLTRSTQQGTPHADDYVSAINSTDEIGKLANSFKQMHDRIREDASSLEQISLELKRERDKALNASFTDPMTGLFNRRKLDEIAENEMKRARRQGTSFDIILIDIDYFKAINDNYGHHQGDNVLKRVADVLSKMSRRPEDFCFRIGGEEFLFMSADQDYQAAKSYAEIMRLEVEAMQIPNKGSKISDYVTLSAGVVSIEPDEEESFYDLLKRADERLYMAKSMGRNRVVASDEG